MAGHKGCMETFELIRDFWPDFQFTKQDFTQCTPDFVINFYQRFVAEINEKVLFLCNEEAIHDELDDLQNFEYQVILFCKVWKIVKRLKFSFSLVDFYIANPKKMSYCLQCSIHFVIYVNNHLDDMFNVINEQLEKITEAEHLAMSKEELLQSNAENAEYLAKLMDECDKLKNELEEMEKKHEKMLEDKAIEDKLEVKNLAEMNDLKCEIDNLEYELKLLEEKEALLQESVITKADYEQLKSVEKYLELEDQNLDIEYEVNIDRELETIKRWEEYAKQLKEINLESLDVAKVHELEQELVQKQNTQKKLEEDFNELKTAIAAKDRKIKELNNTLDKVHVLNSEMERKILTNEKEGQIKCAATVAEITADFEFSQKLETAILTEEEEIRKIAEDEHKANSVIAEQYKRILNMDKMVTTKFRNVLLNMKKHL